MLRLLAVMQQCKIPMATVFSFFFNYMHCMSLMTKWMNEWCMIRVYTRFEYISRNWIPRKSAMIISIRWENNVSLNNSLFQCKRLQHFVVVMFTGKWNEFAFSVHSGPFIGLSACRTLAARLCLFVCWHAFCKNIYNSTSLRSDMASGTKLQGTGLSSIFYWIRGMMKTWWQGDFSFT